MAEDLSAGEELPLRLSPGKIFTLKSAKFDLPDNDCVSVSPRMDLDIWNINNDIVLRITILRGTNKVFFNDRADKSLLDGWGEEKCVELNQEDIDKWQHSGVTISVHDCSTPSNEQYQILFDLTTIYFFEKRFPGPAIKIEYSAQRSPDDTSVSGIPAHGILSDPLKVFTYNVDDLPLTEKQAVKSGSVPSVTAPPHSFTIFHGKATFKPPSAWAFISWDAGNEMRIYFVNSRNILQEYAYSSKNGIGWHLGTLHKLGIILRNPSIAAFRDNGSISVFYQDPASDLIRHLSQGGVNWPWMQEGWANIPVTKALKGSRIAALSFSNRETSSRHVFYQDPKLHVRDHYMDPDREHDGWNLGFLDSGIQPYGTSITAEPTCGNVTWRDEQGRILSARFLHTSQCWYLSNGVVQKPTQADHHDGMQRGDGRH